VSINIDTKPSVHTPAGIARQPETWRRAGGRLLGKIERHGQVAPWSIFSRLLFARRRRLLRAAGERQGEAERRRSARD
jgi:hypothetical protein